MHYICITDIAVVVFFSLFSGSSSSRVLLIYLLSLFFFRIHNLFAVKSLGPLFRYILLDSRVPKFSEQDSFIPSSENDYRLQLIPILKPQGLRN